MHVKNGVASEILCNPGAERCLNVKTLFTSSGKQKNGLRRNQS